MTPQNDPIERPDKKKILVGSFCGVIILPHKKKILCGVIILPHKKKILCGVKFYPTRILKTPLFHVEE
jgi:hypothetical protein